MIDSAACSHFNALEGETEPEKNAVQGHVLQEFVSEIVVQVTVTKHHGEEHR